MTLPRPLLFPGALLISSSRAKARAALATAAIGLVLSGCGFRPLYTGGEQAAVAVARVDLSGSEICAEKIGKALTVDQDSALSVHIRVFEEMVEENIGADREAARLTLHVRADYHIIDRDKSIDDPGVVDRTRTFTKPASQQAQLIEAQNAGASICQSIATEIEGAVRQASGTK